MIAHSVQIVVNELNRQFNSVYGSTKKVVLGNIAMGVGAAPANEDGKIICTIVNYREEKTLKNIPNHTRNDATLKVTYENPPIFLNLQILMTATHSSYASGLLDLSRLIRFLQAQNVYTPETVLPASMTLLAPLNTDLDVLEYFKLILDLYSPSIEEVNQLFGILGGRQYPFVIYTMRMLELKFKSVQRESGVITEVQSDFFVKSPTYN